MRMRVISSATWQCCKGTSTLATSRVTSDDAEILLLPADELRRALAEVPAVSKTIVDALIMRRRRLASRSRICGIACARRRDARDGHQLDDFLDKNHIPHRLIEFESEQGQALSERLHLTSRDLPVLITPAGARLRGRRCAKSLRKPACFGRSRFKMKPKFLRSRDRWRWARRTWPQRSMPHRRD